MVLQASSTQADALAPLQAALLDVLGGILPVADAADVTWIQGCHPFGPAPRATRGRALSTLLVAQARRNAVLARAASARAVAQSVAKTVEAAYTVRLAQRGFGVLERNAADQSLVRRSVLYPSVAARQGGGQLAARGRPVGCEPHSTDSQVACQGSLEPFRRGRRRSVQHVDGASGHVPPAACRPRRH